MQKRKYLALGAAAAMAMPVVSKAANIKFSFDLSDLQVATAAAGPYSPPVQLAV